MNLHEQARAEAEKRYPTGLLGMIQEDDDWERYRQDAFEEGAVWAATRTRVVTTVTELDALPVGSVLLCADGHAREVMRSLRSGETHGALRAFNGEHLIHEGRLMQVLPARVLYDPEETR